MYLRTVGASFALPITSVGTSTGQIEEEQCPVYYTISVPEIDTQILHISIPQELLNESNYLWTVSRKRDVALNISREDTEDEWGLLNLAVQTDDLERVSVGGVEAKRWDTLDLDRVALLVTGDADHAYLGVTGAGSLIHIEGVNQSWDLENVGYERMRVETTDPRDLDVVANLDGEEERIPVFSMTPSYFARV